MGLVRWNEAFALDQVAGDRELLQELIEIFKSSFEADYGMLEKGLAENSNSQIGTALHSIRGAAANLGFEGIAKLAEEVEVGGDEHRIALASKVLSTFEIMLGEVRKM